MFFWRGNGTDGDAPLVDEEAPEIQATSSWGSFMRNPLAPQEDPDDLFSYCTDLSYQTRLYGFLFCFMVGTFLSISSSFFVGMIVLNPAKFAVPYTLGNLLSLGSSMFFVGPKRFFRTMFGDDRRIATSIYLVSLGLTLFSALYLHAALLTFLLIVVQFGSYLWLMASYIPYGRTMLRGTANQAVSMVIS